MKPTFEYSPPLFPFEMLAERKSWSRAIAALALSELQQRANPRQILKSHWPGDDRAAVLLKAAQSPTDTTNSGLPAAVSVATWRSLAPGSAAWRLFDHSSALRLDLSGFNTIEMPNIAALPPVPIWVGESDGAPVVQWTWGKTVLGPAKKILVIAALSDELERATPESAAQLMGRLLSDATQKSIDTAAFDAVAGDDVRPPGLCYGVAPITASAAANPGDAMIEDLAALAGQIGGNGIDTNDVVYIAGPREAQVIKLRAGPRFDNDVLSSLGIPADTVIAVAPSGICSGYQGPPTISTSKEAVLHRNTDPTQPPESSLFQTNLIGIKVHARAAWAAAKGAVSMVGGITW
jgi:hypothetical protein